MQPNRAENEQVCAVDILERRTWNDAHLIVIVGPGGAGKTTLSRVLAPMTGRDLIDLDEEFCSRIAVIDQYIQTNGYPAYKKRNGELARSLVSDLSRPTVLVTSSGFLSSDNPSDVLTENIRLLDNGYTISLLPHADIEIASDIIVKRQLRRGLYKHADQQRRTIRERFASYKSAGDMLVISADSPVQIAKAIVKRLANKTPSDRC